MSLKRDLEETKSKLAMSGKTYEDTKSFDPQLDELFHEDMPDKIFENDSEEIFDSKDCMKMSSDNEKRCINAIDNIDDTILRIRLRNAELIAENEKKISMEKEERYRKEIEQLKARVDKEMPMDNENERRCINASDANIDDTFIDDTTQPGIGKSPELNFADELENWKIPLENLAKEIDMENERYEKEIEQLKDEKKELEDELSCLKDEIRYLKPFEDENGPYIMKLKNEKKEMEQMFNDVKKERDAFALKLMEKLEEDETLEIKKSLMPKAMEIDAIFCAIEALEDHENLSEVAAKICAEFDKKYGPKWHCFIVNPCDDDDVCGWAVEEAENNYIDFLVDEEKRVCLFKPTTSAAE